MDIVLSYIQELFDFTPDPHCPYPSNELSYDYYPENCSKFYECDNGIRYLLDCPVGYFWNPKYNYCDFPENVDCSRSNNTTTTISTTTGFTPDPHCPYPSNELTYDYYPTNCSKFYECDNGIRYLLDCPVGYFWNPKYNYCDFPENVDCSRGNSTGTTTDSTTVTTNFTPDPHCPYPSNKLTYDYYPANCSKFYECDNGIRYLLDCPAGYFWNPKYNYCDFPENVDCSDKNHTTTNASTAATTSIGTTTVSPATSTPATATTTSIGTTASSATTSIGTTTVSPATATTSIYTTASPATSTAATTSSGTTSASSITNSAYTTSIGTRTASPTSSTAATTRIATTTSTPGGLCKGKEDGTLIANPNDCTKYFECSAGMAIEMPCPPGTWWSKTANQCGYTKNDCK